MNVSRLLSLNAGVIGIILCALGCHPQIIRVPQPLGDVPTADDFVAAQQRRLIAVPTLALRGHAELRWSDKTGRHFDDGDFDLIVRPPSDLSLRVSKLGEKFLWVGGGGGQSWIVLPRENPSRAILRSSSQVSKSGAISSDIDHGELGDLGIFMEPARLIEAFGLAKVERQEVSNISWNEVRGAWQFTLPHRRIYARGESLLPVGCDWTNAASEVIAMCALDGFEWIRGDRPVGSPSSSVQALVATRLQFSIWSQARLEQSGAPDGELLLAAEEPSYGGEKIRPQLFNWDDVKAALRPEVIEGPQP